MAIQVEDLVQAVAEGVLRAVEARTGVEKGAPSPAAVGSPGAGRGELINKLAFEVRIRAGGIPPAQFTNPEVA